MTDHTEKAILAGGCFWGVQDLVRKLPGVLSTRVGYTGGDVPNATYRRHGTHAEALEIIFDPEKISYRDLLEFFFQIHDPSTKNRQGNDRGTRQRVGICSSSSSRFTTRARRTGKVTTGGPAIARPSSTPARPRSRSPGTRSPTLTPPGYGRAGLSPRSRPPGRSGRPSRSTRTTSSTTPTVTLATSSARAGSCRTARTR